MAEQHISAYEAKLMQKPLPEFNEFKEQFQQNYPSCIITDIKAIYLGRICATGNLFQVQQFCSNLMQNELVTVLNARPIQINKATVLHATLFFNLMSDAVDMYSYLRELGAKPSMDIFAEYPWEQQGDVWTNMSNNLTNYRDPAEFIATYEIIKEYEKALDPNFNNKYYPNANSNANLNANSNANLNANPNANLNANPNANSILSASSSESAIAYVNACIYSSNYIYDGTQPIG